MDELRKSDSQFPQPRSRGFIEKPVGPIMNTMQDIKFLVRILEKGNATYKEEIRLLKERQLEHLKRIDALEEFISKITMTGLITEEYAIIGRDLLRNKITSDTKV